MDTRSFEQERLRALDEYKVLDTLPEKEFDDIVELASSLCGTPISLISLLDHSRQWFKARTGLEEQETPIELAFCKYAIQKPDEILVVSDTLQDERFKNNPLVTGELHFRFYAGAPLVNPEGQALGTLCIIDKQPREITETQRRTLQILARRVVERLELRKKNLQQQEALQDASQQLLSLTERLLNAQQTARIGSWDWDAESGEIFWSPIMYNLFGIEELTKTISLQDWMACIHHDDLPAVQSKILLSAKSMQPETVEYRVLKKNGDKVWLRAKEVPVVNNQGEVIRVNGTVQDITREKEHGQEIIYAVLDGEEKERKRIAGELHDSLGQVMGAMSLHLQLISEKHAEVDLSLLKKLVETSIKEYRNISHNLYPPDVLHKSLQQLLQQKAEELNALSPLQVNLEYKLENANPLENLAHKKELYRIFQELTTNSLKHAKASELNIRLSTSDGYIVLEVQDNGIGFKLSELDTRKKRGIGIRNLYERAEILGGQLLINTSPGKGTSAKLFMKP